MKTRHWIGSVTAVAFVLSAVFCGRVIADDAKKPQEQPNKPQVAPPQYIEGQSPLAKPPNPNAVPQTTNNMEGRDPVSPISPPPDNTPLLVTITPLVVELGDIPTGTDQAKGSVKLKNVTDKPVRLLECKPSCGCTTTKCPRGHDILPGEEIEVEVMINPGLKGQPHFSKMVTFKIEGQRDMMVTINARVVEYVVIEPDEIDAKSPGDGKVTLRSIDNQPFVVKDVMPAVFDGITEESSTTHVLTFSQEKWEALGKRRQFSFVLDHPKTKSVQAHTKLEVPPTPPPPGDPPVDDKSTALFNAVRAGNIESALKAITDGAPIDGADASGQTALMLAAERGNVPMIKALLGLHANVEAGNRAGFPALTYAAQSQNVEAMKTLLAAGANPNSRDDTGGSPLMWACGPKGFPAATAALLEAGADVHAVNTLGMSAMTWAGGFADPERIKMLYKAGADVNLFGGPEDMTPLMFAVQINKPEAVKALLDIGADFKAQDGARRTAMDYAVERADGSGPEIIKMLIAAGAAPPKNMPDSANPTPTGPTTAPAAAAGTPNK